MPPPIRPGVPPLPNIFRVATVLLIAAAFQCPAQAAEFRADIEYGVAGGESLKLDVSIPDPPGPHPVAILVHGGGWSRGDKHSVPPGDSADISPWFPVLTAANFTWFSINYRLAPVHSWPACLEDVQTAIRWVKAHAAEFGGDPDRIALFGHSAGGHLVCLAGTAADPATRVQAVVGFAAVTDHVADSERRGGVSTSVQALLGLDRVITDESRAVLRSISPLNHVRPGLPPFLLVHGTADKSVPYAQSTAFQEKLRAAGVTCDLLTIPDAPHALATWHSLAPNYETEMIDWLRARLGPGGQSPARVNLWNGRDLTGWSLYLNNPSVDPASAWSVHDGALRLDSKANGYLRTERSYSDYRLHVEWRWLPDAPANANSGVMLHTHGPDTIWPLSFEAQLKNQNAGQVVGMGLDIPAAPLLNNRKRSPRLAEPSEKPLGEWNTYDIVCRGDTIEVSVNGVRQNRVDQLPVTAGAIALQLEGYPIEFRHVWLESL